MNHNTNTNSRPVIGTIKRYDPTRGFGFIRPDEGGIDLFFQRSELSEADAAVIRERDRVRFQVEHGPTGRLKPTNITRLS